MSNNAFMIIYPYGELNPFSIIRPQTETAKSSALALPLVSSYQIYTYLLLIIIFIERCQLTTYSLDITDFLCSPAPHPNFLSASHYQISNLKSFYTYMHIYIWINLDIVYIWIHTCIHVPLTPISFLIAASALWPHFSTKMYFARTNSEWSDFGPTHVHSSMSAVICCKNIKFTGFYSSTGLLYGELSFFH